MNTQSSIGNRPLSQKDFIKTEYENILNNKTHLEEIINLNYRFRGGTFDGIKNFIIDEKDKMFKIYQDLKKKLKALGEASSLFVQSCKASKHPQIAFKDLNEFFLNKQRDLYEKVGGSQLNIKNTFVSSFLVGGFEIQEELIIKDGIKDDVNIPLQKYFEYIIKNINNIEYEFTKLKIRKIQTLISGKDQVMIRKIKIENTCTVLVLVSFEGESKTIRIAVGGRKEKFYSSNNCVGKEKRYEAIKGGGYPEGNSQCIVYKKGSRGFTNKLENIFAKMINKKSPNLELAFTVFYAYLNEYHELFNKKCAFCGRCGRFNIIEKCFYPPIMRLFSFDKGVFYHEDCFSIFNGRAA